MPIHKLMKRVPPPVLPADGYMDHDKEALTNCQVDCTRRLGKTLQLEQENYLIQHSEVKAMVELFTSKMVQNNKRKEDILKEAAEYFSRPASELDQEIRQRLNLPAYGPYTQRNDLPAKYSDRDLQDDLRNIVLAHYPLPQPKSHSPSVCSINTQSSSFLSIKTSDTTLSTPEPIPTPEPTLSETMMTLVSNTVDKAIFLHVDDRILNYDTAYIELAKSVEEAMEIPVTDIKKDIAELFLGAYKMFEIDILIKERIAAEIAWEKRMRKKLKRTLRRLNNFKGHETPPTPKSELSSHESYKVPPPRPCECHPQFHYNRYPKDRFGIYLPREEKFSHRNITVTPAISGTSDDEHDKASQAS